MWQLAADLFSQRFTNQNGHGKLLGFPIVMGNHFAVTLYGPRIRGYQCLRVNRWQRCTAQ